MFHDNIKIKTELRRKQDLKENNIDLRNVMYVLRPILIVGQVLGIFRFRVKNYELLPTDWKMKCVVMCIVGVYVCASAVFFCPNISDNALFPLLEALYAINSMMVMIYYIVTLIIHSITKTCNNVQIVSSLAKLDSKLHFSTRCDFYKKSRAYTLYMLVFVLFTNSTFTIWYYFTNPVDLMKSMWNDIFNFLQDVETILICIMIYMLKIRLAAINKDLGKLRRDGDSIRNKSYVNTIRHNFIRVKSQPQTTELGNSSAMNIRNLSVAYVIIGETCSALNSLYNFQFLMVLLSTFLCIFINQSLLLHSHQLQITLNEIIATTCWGSTKLVHIIMLSFICESLLWTRSDTKDLVNALVMDYGLPRRARAQAKAFMELVDAWPLRIFVYDMFPVDISLLLKFISVSTTYLIIMIQISKVV